MNEDTTKKCECKSHFSIAGNEVCSRRVSKIWYSKSHPGVSWAYCITCHHQILVLAEKSETFHLYEIVDVSFPQYYFPYDNC